MRHVADLLEAQRPMMYGVCLRVLRHPQDAEDACQEALIEAARGADTLRDEHKLAAWARRVATTTALDFRRRIERRRTHESRAIPPGSAPREEVDVREALQALEEPERRAVEAHYLEGRPLRELAREQRVSEVAVWKRLGKANSKLRLLLAAALPAAIIAASLVFAVLRPPAPSPALPQEVREPWPWELPPRTWPEPVRKAWTALQRRVTIDLQDVPMTVLLESLGGMIGHPIEIAPEAVEDGERVSFKVADIAADGALRLALQPRGRGFEIRDDGSIVVVKALLLDPTLDRGRSETIRAAQRLETAKRKPGPTKPLALGRAALAKLVDGPKGPLALDDYLAYLRETTGVPIILEASQADGRTEVVGPPDRLSLEAQLRRGLEPLDITAVPTYEGAIFLTRSDKAARLRASKDYLEQERVEERLDRPLEAGSVESVPKLVRLLERVLRAPVLATKEAWASTATATPKPGETIAALLDRLGADGIRWMVRDGALYLVK
jgi:RNA polymerase sigma factor (sigma-70 family)